jgi:ankyrin repeat protein
MAMAEIQTISAAFDIARLAWEACVFLKKVKDADRTVAEVYERSTRLNQVLNGLALALQTREEKGLAPQDDTHNESVKRIRQCIDASGKILRKVDLKVGGFENVASGTAFIDRVKIAFRHPGIARLQTDLDARVQALQTELSILQLSDQAQTQTAIDCNHREVIQTLSHLEEQLTSGNMLLDALLSEHRKISRNRGSVNSQGVVEAAVDEDDADTEAIEDLRNCLEVAEELHERYTSKYAPDDRSIRFNRDVWSEQGRESLCPNETAVTDDSGSIPADASSNSQTNMTSIETLDEDEEDHSDIWPLKILNSNIDKYHARANKERDQGHYNQAEVNLQSVIKYSEMRQKHYEIPFDDRTELHEEIAILYQQQHKWGEAVSKIHQLLRDSTDELVVARQNQILASIYYDRHLNRSGPALSNVTDDIENAERHAKRAFNKRFKLSETDSLSNDELEKHSLCIQLLIRILETLDKIPEADVLKDILSPDSVSIDTGRLTRRSTMPIDIIEDKHELLINAIRAGDSESVQSLLDEGDVNVEQVCRQKMQTPLMHAVEMSDETIVHKLLSSGADIGTANKRGLTALHVAASLGLHDMVRCLIHHDANVDAGDNSGETVLMKAVQYNQGTVVQILFDAGADMGTKNNNDEYSLLHYSIRLPGTNMTNLVLDLAPDLKDSVDKAGKTALHHCADYEWVDQAAALLSHRNHVEVSAVDSIDRSPLYLAASKPSTARRESMVQLFVDHGAYVDKKRPPPRWRDYAALKPFQTPRRASRHDSISTNGSIGSTSTGTTGKLSRIWSAKLQRR